jgi:hypothetical protein
VREVEDALLFPPATPRPISDRYAWRLMMVNTLAIVGFVFALLGAIFGMVGFGLTVGIVTAFVGIPFLLLGLVFLILGGGMLIWRYQEAMKVVYVLRWGEVARGQVTDVREDLSVVINNRNPWVIDYSFRTNGQDVQGSISTLNRPAAYLQPGRLAYVLYMPDSPRYNALYPHP